MREDSVLIVTRAMTPALCALQQSFLDVPYEHRLLFNHTGRSGALTYFFQLCQLNADWIVNIDEDAFVFDNERLMRLLAFMKEEGLHCCGMPDGGACAQRTNSPLVFNAFFNILHLAAIRAEFDIDEIERLEYCKDWEQMINQSELTAGYRLCSPRHGYFYEPYYRFFYWLIKRRFRFLRLGAESWRPTDPAVILKDHEQRPFLLHCWFARQFDDQRDRFATIVSDVQQRWKGRGGRHS
jgi:hypothetical protein